MKKIVSILLLISLLLSAFLVFASCEDDGETIYVAVSDFSYSYDKGHSYGNGTKEYAVGETIYLKVKAKVTSNKEEPSTISMKLTIPCITSLDAKYYDGQPITPTYDAVNNVTTYEFTITAAMNAQEWEFVFQFTPNENAFVPHTDVTELEVRMVLEFDDNVGSMYDKQNTIKFVASSEEE